VNGTEALKKAVSGVGVTPVTPFTDDLSGVDRAALKSNLQYLLDAGVTLLYPAGNTGEVMSLSPDEWTTVVEVALEVADDTAMVLPGIGHEYPVAIELARRARTLGVDGVLLMPRIQPYVASAGVATYWVEILEVVQAPAVVYKRGLPEEDDLLELVQHDQVIACKYADRDISSFASTAAHAAAADVIWTCGLAERYAPFFHQAGTTGFTSGMANFAPEMALEMHEALTSGNLARSHQLRELCLPFEEIRARHNDAFNVAAVKAAMDLRGLRGGRVRPPLVDLDPSSTTELKGILDSLTGART
jgi:4-hydroxy-tetrahydrodipicolinate synthase